MYLSQVFAFMNAIKNSEANSPIRKQWKQFQLYSTPDSCLTEVHLRLGCNFDLSFLQIPHWLKACRIPASGWLSLSFFGHPWFVYSFPPFRVETGFPPASDCPYRAHPPAHKGCFCTHAGFASSSLFVLYSNSAFVRFRFLCCS